MNVLRSTGGRPGARVPPSSTGSDLHAHVIDLGTPDWCWRQLRSAAQGVLSARRPVDVVSQDVTYTVQDR